MLAFHDVLHVVHKHAEHFSTSVYRKRTFTGLYMRWNYFSPSSRKTNLLNRLTQRTIKLCSALHLSDEISNIKKIFLYNGFPEHAVNACISNKIASLAVEPKFGPRKCLTYVRLPWKGQISVQLERQINSTISSCFRAADLRAIHYTIPLLPNTRIKMFSLPHP